MPMRYRNEVAPAPPPEPTVADDSIVLSDLVRTGEASRLRRRGAMRLDHNLLAAQRNESGRRTPPRPVVVARTPSWIEPPSDDEDSTQAWEQGYDSSPSRPQNGSGVLGSESYGYTLYCGGEEPLSQFSQNTSLYRPSPLPWYPPASSDGHRRRDERSLQRTNGCGAVIHLRASRRDGSSVWVGKDEATSAVVPMDASYFERPTGVRMIRSDCGCVREGVGCAICGNTIGTRYKPCQTAADGLFSPRRSTPPPICPQGPRYWHGSASTVTSSTSPSYIYTFFASNVTCASPMPVPRLLSASSREESFYAADSAFDMSSFLDRLPTASPTPMSDDERDGLQQDVRSQLEPDYDPDGVPFLPDPGSPDKSSVELMLLPER